MAAEITGSPGQANADGDSWTVAIYQAGDRNVNSEMVWTLQEIKDVLLDSLTWKDWARTLKVVAQFDPLGAMPRRFDFTQSGSSSLDRSGQGEPERPEMRSRVPPLSAFEKPELIEREIQEFSKEIREKGRMVVKSLLENSADPHVIQNFIDWVRSNDADLFVETGIRAASKNATEEPTVVEMGLSQNSADAKVVERFLQWARGYDADHFMLILSGHGGGAIGNFLPDQDPRHGLSIRDLGRLVESVPGRIDILGLDGCNMTMAEVCHELSKSCQPDKSELPKVSIVIGSEGNVLNNGWPFRRILGAMLTEKDGSRAAIARNIVQEYIAYYVDYLVAGISVDLAAIDLAKFKVKLLPAFTRLVTVLQEALEMELGDDEVTKHPLCSAVLLAHGEAQSYKNGEYVDLYDFCYHLQKRAPKGSPLERLLSIQRRADVVLPIIPVEPPEADFVDVASACGDVMKAIETAAVVLESGYNGRVFQHSHGLSVYFPWADSAGLSTYQNSAFARETGWGRFLRDLVKKTQVPPRPGRKERSSVDP